MSKFFTSDLHFFHKNIVEYSGRPWTSEEQTETIIERINAKVGKGDELYHLGDFAFRNDKQVQQVVDIINRLNGKITFIRGNHCPSRLWNAIGNMNIPRVTEICDYKRIKVGQQQINMFHYPMEVWDKMHHGAWHLHGHCHGSLPAVGKRLDVGLDNHPDFQVFSYDEIEAHMAKQEFVIKDHHTGGRQ
ncbi:hypothetical protein D3C79_708280 [compost metagenome]